MDALKAETYVYEPVNEFELTVPKQAISTAMYKLATIPATFREPILSNNSYQLTGSLPVAKTEILNACFIHLQKEKAYLQRGQLVSQKHGSLPTRKRVDYNPLNRKDYLLHVLKAY